MMRKCTCQYPQPPDEHTKTAQAANALPEPCANAAAERGVPLEAEINDADPLDVSVVNDPENPKIVVGGRWPDIVAFRKAIRHFAVTTALNLLIWLLTSQNLEQGVKQRDVLGAYMLLGFLMTRQWR